MSDHFKEGNNLHIFEPEIPLGTFRLDNREFIPLDGKLRLLPSKKARKCLQNKTIAFIGDSQIRDLGFAMAEFLNGKQSWNGKDDKIHRNYYKQFEIKGEDFLTFPNENFPYVPHHSSSFRKEENWEILLYHNFIRDSNFDKMEEVFLNKYRNHDLIFISFGVHQARVLEKDAYEYKNFLFPLLKYWYHQEKDMPPVVWLPQNPECAEILNPLYAEKQPKIMEMANNIANRLFRQKPYLDIAHLVKFQLCALSADGLHMKQWTDISRAKLILNEICDENWNFQIPNYMIAPQILKKQGQT